MQFTGFLLASASQFSVPIDQKMKSTGCHNGNDDFILMYTHVRTEIVANIISHCHRVFTYVIFCGKFFIIENSSILKRGYKCKQTLSLHFELLYLHSDIAKERKEEKRSDHQWSSKPYL